MKKIYLLFIGLIIMFAACNKSGASKKNSEKQYEKSIVETTIDSLKQQKNIIDSLTSNGMIIHKDIYSLGKLKTVTFTVNSIQIGTKVLNYINLRKDCGNEYYYSWENAILLYGECDTFIKAIDVIKKNLNRSVEHEEEYIFITEDDIALAAFNSGNQWNIRLTVDTYAKNSSITLTADELDSLRSLVIEGKMKMEKLIK